MRKNCLLIFVLIITISCNDSVVFDKYKPISKLQWHKDSIVKFEFSPIDTTSKNNLYVQLRNNNEYAYSNLFLIVGIDFPNKTRVVDTLEYEMASADGAFLGNGLTDLKENKLEYKTDVVFPTSGAYDISIQHAMRKSGETDGIEWLLGITDVGLLIEKSQ